MTGHKVMEAQSPSHAHKITVVDASGMQDFFGCAGCGLGAKPFTSLYAESILQDRDDLSKQPVCKVHMRSSMVSIEIFSHAGG